MNQPSAPTATPQQLEKIAMRAAQMIRPGQRVGLGSGRAAHAFVRALGQRIHAESLNIVGIPTSEATAQVAHNSGVPLGTLEQINILDLAVDGADEVDPNLNLLKGGGGDLLREKLIASMAARIIILVGQEKLVPRLGAKFPVFLEVVAFALPVISRKLTSMGATVQTRRRPDGSLFLTDNGNPILHAVFGPPPHHLNDPEELDLQLHYIPGIIETGIFLNMAHEILVANLDGSIEHRRRIPS
ncbi:MAG: ribose 5-phosphate isomerase A [Phycisphaerae bacterium]|nr:ribose 5-phosphate isomerase A [Phycisphaerae bacterium]